VRGDVLLAGTGVRIGANRVPAVSKERVEVAALQLLVARVTVVDEDKVPTTDDGRNLRQHLFRR